MEYNNYAETLSKTELYKNININTCPKCKKRNFIKYGFFNGIQRYKCKECNHTFSKVTGSLYMYSKKEPRIWLKFIEMTFQQISLRVCSKYLKISLDTAFTWRHKVLYSLSEINKTKKFNEKVHMEATKIGANNKGNYKIHRPNYINGTKRLFRFLDADNIEIIGARSEENNMILIPNRIIKCPNSKRTLEKEEHYKNDIQSKITSKTYIKSYKASNIIKIAIKHNNKLPESIKVRNGYENIKDYGKNNIYPSVKDNLSSDKIIKNLNRNINYWLECYRGVSTKYLQQYFNLIIHKNNIDDCDYRSRYMGIGRKDRIYEGDFMSNDTVININDASTNSNYVNIFLSLVKKSKFIRKVDIFNIDIFESKLIYYN